MTGPDWDGVRDVYFGYLEDPNLYAAARLITDLAEGGATIGALVREVLRPAQIEVGKRWQANEWSVADEHAATAVTEAALMAATALRVSGNVKEAGIVVLACAPGEWHTVPLRMVAGVLEESGRSCHFLGPSVPPAHLQAYLEKTSPDALILSCSSPLTLGSAVEAIAAAHSAGVRVLAGGRGFGPDNHRASLAAADGWADDPTTAADTLAAWGRHPAVAPSQSDLRATDELSEERLLDIRRTVRSTLTLELPPFRTYTTEQWARTAEDVDLIIRFATTAVSFRDDRIFADFAAWLADVLAARDVPTTLLEATLHAIADALGSTHPEMGALIDGAARGAVLDATFSGIPRQASN
jgi:methanogenic corrinoid protein MtbC1